MKHWGVRDGFIQRGGFRVLAQGALLLVILGFAVVCRGEPRHRGLLVGGLILLTIAALCGTAGAIAFSNPNEWEDGSWLSNRKGNASGGGLLFRFRW